MATHIAGVSRTGKIVYADDSGEREFSPNTQQVVRYLVVAFLAVVAVIAVLSVIAPMPWSPLGQVVEPQSPSRSTVQPDEDVRSA